MRWRQFFTPVRSMPAPEAKTFMAGLPANEFQLIDVRQPGEYEAGHLPGAQLMPLADLGERSGALDPTKPTLVYCAIGGRSRVASQMLAGKGFEKVINMAGGIKAWDSNTAVGAEDVGLELFHGTESLADVLAIAYGLESALLAFYREQAKAAQRADVSALFDQLATIEMKHQQRILEQYRRVIADNGQGADAMPDDRPKAPLEGGLTTEQYIKRYQPDLSVAAEVVSLAMAIEAQALDLYQRAAERAATTEIKAALQTIAEEEREHIRRLGALLDAPGGERRKA